MKKNKKLRKSYFSKDKVGRIKEFHFLKDWESIMQTLGSIVGEKNEKARGKLFFIDFSVEEKAKVTFSTYKILEYLAKILHLEVSKPINKSNSQIKEEAKRERDSS